MSDPISNILTEQTIDLNSNPPATIVMGSADGATIGGAVSPPPPPPPSTSNVGEVLHPTTTAAQDRVTAGQRRINFIWEITQASIAVLVTGTTVFVLGRVAINLADVTANQLIAAMQLNVMATLILSFYFSRTNHAAIGGVGTKPEMSEYRGR